MYHAALAATLVIAVRLLWRAVQQPGLGGQGVQQPGLLWRAVQQPGLGGQGGAAAQPGWAGRCGSPACCGQGVRSKDNRHCARQDAKGACTWRRGRRGSPAHTSRPNQPTNLEATTQPTQHPTDLPTDHQLVAAARSASHRHALAFLDCPGSRSALLLGTRSTLKTLACRCTSEKSSVVCCRDPPKLLVSSAPSLMRRSQSSASVGSGWEAAPGAFEKGCPGAGCTTRSASTPMRGESWTALSSLLMLRLMSLASLEDSMLLCER
eukprot:365420-Chlamydomonas_euryale.AAC.10